MHKTCDMFKANLTKIICLSLYTDHSTDVKEKKKRHECRTHSILIAFAAYSVINNKRNDAVVPEMRIKKNITAMTMKHTGGNPL